MDSSLTNLLPPERLKALRRERVIRAWNAGLWATLLFVLLNILLLIPAYFYLSGTSAVQAPTAPAAYSPVEARLKDLLSYAHEPRAAQYLRAILGVRHPGVRLTAFTYTPRTGSVPAGLTLSGDAETREDLLQYDQALNNVDGVEWAQVPVATYSQDKDISFTFDIVFE